VSSFARWGKGRKGLGGEGQTSENEGALLTGLTGIQCRGVQRVTTFVMLRSRIGLPLQRSSSLLSPPHLHSKNPWMRAVLLNSAVSHLQACSSWKPDQRWRQAKSSRTWPSFTIHVPSTREPSVSSIVTLETGSGWRIQR